MAEKHAVIRAADCAYTAYGYADICNAYGSVSDPAIPNKAYCGSGNTWYGGDSGSGTCTAIAGAGRWNIGGEVDCHNLLRRR